MVKIIRAESEKTLMRKVKECFFSRNESSYALVMKEKNPLDSAFSVIHKVLRLGLKDELVKKSKIFDESSSSTFWASDLQKVAVLKMSCRYGFKSCLNRKRRFCSIMKCIWFFKFPSLSWVIKVRRCLTRAKRAKLAGFPHSKFNKVY